jgi:hypothetical protein
MENSIKKTKNSILSINSKVFLKPIVIKRIKIYLKEATVLKELSRFLKIEEVRIGTDEGRVFK